MRVGRDQEQDHAHKKQQLYIPFHLLYIYIYVHHSKEYIHLQNKTVNTRSSPLQYILHTHITTQHTYLTYLRRPRASARRLTRVLKIHGTDSSRCITRRANTIPRLLASPSVLVQPSEAAEPTGVRRRTNPTQCGGTQSSFGFFDGDTCPSEKAPIS